jgi:hypothetical protein
MTHFVMGLSLLCAVSWIRRHLAPLKLFLTKTDTTQKYLASRILPLSTPLVSPYEFVNLMISNITLIVLVRNNPVLERVIGG